MRLIDADALERYSAEDCGASADVVFVTDIEKAPTVEAEQVKRGEWLDVEYNPFWKAMMATCSSCSVRGEVRFKGNECGFVIPDSPRCPNCGAHMSERGVR